MYVWVPIKCETKQKRSETKRNEINENETKRNETKRNQQKRNETKRNQRNENEIKRNQRKQNEINETIEKGRKNNRGLKEIKPISHTCLSFIRRGQDLITIEQEYYAFIQQESVLFTQWLLLNLGTIRATSSLLKREELK